MRKVTFNTLIGLLSNGKDYKIELEEVKGDLKYITVITIGRLDVIPLLKSKYQTKTYVLTIEKCKEGLWPEEGELEIDIRIEFNKINDVLDYLQKNSYIIVSDYISDYNGEYDKT